MCEGPNELKVMNILLENDALIFTEDDLLGLTAYHARQIKSSAQVRTALNLYPGNDVLVIKDEPRKPPGLPGGFRLLF